MTRTDNTDVGRTMSVDSSRWPKWLRDGRRRYVHKMAPLTGEDAAVLLHVGLCWLGLVYVVGFLVFLPAGVLAQVLALPLLWVPAALAVITCIVAGVRARRRMREGAAAAQTFLASKYGFPFPLPPTNYSVPPWRHFINRVLAEQARGSRMF